jgi:glycosyltransferase involved in cell wall biosynthesis
MKILYLLTQDIESPSGKGRFFAFARELVRLGHQVTIAALHANYDELNEKHFFQDGVEVRYVAQMHVIKKGDQKTYFPPGQLLAQAARATRELSRAVLDTQADVIHVCKPHPMNGLAGLFGSRLRGIRLFLDCDDYEAGVGHFSGRWQRWGVAFFEKQMPKHAELITTNTHFMRQKLLSWGIPEEKIQYIPNGVDRSWAIPPNPEEVEALRRELGLSGKRVVSYIGSLSLAGHAVDLLVESFAKVHSGMSDTTLMLVGGGEDIDQLKNQVRSLGLEDAVRFTGRVPYERVKLYYALSDVTVDPVYDNDAARGRCPLKLFESWACGVPCVTADVGDRRILMGDPQAGILARPGNADALVDAILSIFSETEQIKAIYQIGNERVKDFYWENLVEGLEAAYMRL